MGLRQLLELLRPYQPCSPGSPAGLLCTAPLPPTRPPGDGQGPGGVPSSQMSKRSPGARNHSDSGSDPLCLASDHRPVPPVVPPQIQPLPSPQGLPLPRSLPRTQGASIQWDHPPVHSESRLSPQTHSAPTLRLGLLELGLHPQTGAP